MPTHPRSSFITRMRRKLFKWRMDYEIGDRIFPHLRREVDHGYPFATDEELDERSEEINPYDTLETIERCLARMPKAYGKGFRFLLYRDLHERLAQYEELARRRVKPASVDTRFVATHA